MALVKGPYQLPTLFNRPSGTTKESEAVRPLAFTPPLSPVPRKDWRKVVECPEDLKYLSPIRYAYDPVPRSVSYLTPTPLPFPSHASRVCAGLSSNSIRVHPLRGGLPYRSSLDYVRGSKHFRANILEATALLESIAADESATNTPVILGGRRHAGGVTLAALAEKELRPGMADKTALATTYMFPAADEKRLRIIATLMIMLFLFDDKAEETPEGAPLDNFRKDFIRHFQDPGGGGGCFVDEPTSDFHRHTRATMKSIWEEDAISGNGGMEMVEAVRGAFRCVHPRKDFQTVEAYLQFRRSNVGAQFVIAAAKFTIGSSVDVEDPRFARYLRLIGDHYGIINDMASFEKEARALEERGENTNDDSVMINIVSVIERLLSLPGPEAAKVAAYSYQLQVESWILEEIELLAREGDLTDEEWWFLEVVFLTATGNTFFCMTSARYGGQAALIDAPWY